MKKLWLWIGISAIVLTCAGYAGYHFLQFAEDHEINSEPATQASGRNGESPYETREEEHVEQTKYIGTYELTLIGETTQDEIIEVMHKMTHQKVKAQDKWGAIPMAEDTINQVYEFLSDCDFDRKNDLMEIVSRWKEGDFLM
jgi:hypothetical protein